MTQTPPGQDRPTAAELMEIIAETLSDTIVPATAPEARHQARVAANLCRIIGRELTLGDPAEANDLPPSLLECSDHEADQAMAQVTALVRAKLAVAKPGYDRHDSQAEADAVR